LLDLPDLLRELRGLERRRGASGRDRVDHAPGAHDDWANAAAGALVAVAGAVRRTPQGLLFQGADDIEAEDLDAEIERLTRELRGEA
jgi:hypothetical protein